MLRGEKIKDTEICNKADKCMALLDNLSMEIALEDENTPNSQ
jgi:hypothetical protein